MLSLSFRDQGIFRCNTTGRHFKSAFDQFITTESHNGNIDKLLLSTCIPFKPLALLLNIQRKVDRKGQT